VERSLAHKGCDLLKRPAGLRTFDKAFTEDEATASLRLRHARRSTFLVEHKKGESGIQCRGG